MRLSLLLLACAALGSNVLRAGTLIYSNYDSSVTVDQPGGYQSGALSISYSDGVRFTVNDIPDPGFVFSLADISFVGSVSNVADPITASLYSSVNNLPGSPLFTFAPLTLTNTTAEYHLTPSDPFTLTTGVEYWFVLNDPNQGDLNWNWATGTDFGIATQSGEGANWVAASYTLGSLRVTANQVPGSVPEPSTFLALGGGLMLILGKRLRKG